MLLFYGSFYSTLLKGHYEMLVLVSFAALLYAIRKIKHINTIPKKLGACWNERNYPQIKILCMKQKQINTISQSYSKLQPELSQIFFVTDGNMGRGQSLWGGPKKSWWVAAERDPQLFGKLLQTYESESGHAGIPQSRWDIISLSLSSHSGSSCYTTLLSSPCYSLTF